MVSIAFLKYGWTTVNEENLVRMSVVSGLFMLNILDVKCFELLGLDDAQGN
jgi:hypothetical protein